MSFLLLVYNLLSQNCYTFAVYSQLCQSKTKWDSIPFARDVRSVQLIVSSSPTSTEEEAPTEDTYLDTDEE